MLKTMNHHCASVQEPASPPSTRSSSTTASSTDTDESPASSNRFDPQDVLKIQSFRKPTSQLHSHKSLAVLSGHVGSVCCLALCGEFLLSASQGRDIIVWQQPDLRVFAKFGQGDGSVKALVTVGTKVFTAHQDSRIRVWKITRSSENVFRLVDTLPTTKDYLGRFMKHSNYVQTRRNHKSLWIQHSDSISCLAFSNGLIYSGSWDKTLKVWRLSDLKCLESIKAHDDAINALVSCNELVYSASADGKIKAWGRDKRKNSNSSISISLRSSKNHPSKNDHVLKGTLEGHKDVSFNSVVVSGDGKWVYGGGSDGYVLVWEMDDKNGDSVSWKLVAEVKAHDMAVLCICLVGDVLCSGSADKSIGIWRRENGNLINFGEINGHEGPVKCLQASPNSVGGGFMLYSGGLDRSLRVWWVPKHDGNKEHDSAA